MPWWTSSKVAALEVGMMAGGAAFDISRRRTRGYGVPVDTAFESAGDGGFESANQPERPQQTAQSKRGAKL